MTDFALQLRSYRIIPVLTVESSNEAVSVCKALQAGGIKTVEITLRTTAGFDAIAAVNAELQNFDVGAGTIKTPSDLEKLANMGAAFAVSPGYTAELNDCAAALEMNWLPGIATASELMRGLADGRRCFKLFPAQAVGGIALLKSLAAPFAEACFCPTGGISPDNYQSYLRLANVLCVGGSWMVSRELIENAQWDKISELSRQCMSGGQDQLY